VNPKSKPESPPVPFKTFIDDKGLGGLSCRNESGGAAVLIYPSNRVEFTTDLSENGQSLLKFIRVGEDGTPYRCYTKCCGSQLNNAIFPNLIAINSNGVLNPDGTKYDRGHVLNVKVSESFDPAMFPEPKHDTITPGMLVAFLTRLMNPAHPKPFDKRYKELFPEPSECEVVPITWEDNVSDNKINGEPERAKEQPMQDSSSSGMSLSC